MKNVRVAVAAACLGVVLTGCTKLNLAQFLPAPLTGEVAAAPPSPAGRWYYLGQAGEWVDLWAEPEAGVTRTLAGYLGSNPVSGEQTGRRLHLDLGEGLVADLELVDGEDRLDGTLSRPDGPWPSRAGYFLKAPAAEAQQPFGGLSQSLSLEGPWYASGGKGFLAIRGSASPLALTLAEGICGPVLGHGTAKTDGTRLVGNLARPGGGTFEIVVERSEGGLVSTVSPTDGAGGRYQMIRGPEGPARMDGPGQQTRCQDGRKL